MDIATYTELTGITVPASREAAVTASIRRTQTKLEGLLGYTLKPQHLYTEKGKVTFEGDYPVEDLTVLLPPDEEQGGYKLFTFNEADKYFHVDPFTALYRVKLVMPLNDSEFVTVRTLEHALPQFGNNGFGRFIERYADWFSWDWYLGWRWRFQDSQYAGLMLAVEADWMTKFPEELMYLWADMVTHQADPNNNIKSESVDGHSWSKADTTAPELLSESRALLMQYAGPAGKITRNPTC